MNRQKKNTVIIQMGSKEVNHERTTQKGVENVNCRDTEISTLHKDHLTYVDSECKNKLEFYTHKIDYINLVRVNSMKNRIDITLHRDYTCPP